MSIIWVFTIACIILFGGGFIWGFVVRGWEVKKLEKKYDDYFQLSIERMCDTQDELYCYREDAVRLWNEVVKYDKTVPSRGQVWIDKALSRSERPRTQSEVICALLEEMKRGTERTNP